MLLEVRGALTAEQIEERTKHSAVAGTPLAEALRTSAKVDALDDGSFRYKVRRGGAPRPATSLPAGPGAAVSCVWWWRARACSPLRNWVDPRWRGR